ncbi:MAG: molybdenum cofactor guanylyltransferase [Candidatus Dormibacteria bacterium]
MLRTGGLTSPPMSGVLLCGGESSRMGFDKALLEMDGRMIVEVLAERLGDVCDEVLLATGQPGRLGWMDYPEVADAVAYAGPLAGLVAAFTEAKHEMLAVIAVDMPAANPVLLRYLADRVMDFDAALPEGSRGPEPLHAVYGRSALPALERGLHGRDRSMRGVVADLRVNVCPSRELLQAGFGTSFAANVNDPDDLWMLRHEVG